MIQTGMKIKNSTPNEIPTLKVTPFFKSVYSIINTIKKNSIIKSAEVRYTIF